MAAIMEMGTNIGLTKMAEATPGISYHQLANAAQWRLHEDSLSKAQATLVNFQHYLSYLNIGEMAALLLLMACVYKLVFLLFMLMLTHITELGKELLSIDSQTINFLPFIQRLLTLTLGMPTML